MKDSFHDPLVSSEIKPPSERSTGLMFAVLSLIVAYISRGYWPIMIAGIAVAAAFASASFAAPRLLAPLNHAWFRLSHLLSGVVNPVVMLLIFAIAFVPMGYLMRLWRDPLVSRRRSNRRSYWIDRDPENASQSMRNQF